MLRPYNLGRWKPAVLLQRLTKFCQLLNCFCKKLHEQLPVVECSAGPPGPGTAARKHAQFYDTECLELKRLWHRHAKQWPKTPETKELEKQYKRLTRRKKRAFERAECLRLAEQLREDPMAFHKAMRTKTTPISSAASTTNRLGRLFTYDGHSASSC